MSAAPSLSCVDMLTVRHFFLPGKSCLYQHSVSWWVAESDKTLFKFPIEQLQLGSQLLNALSRSEVRGATLTSFHQCFITYTAAENSTCFDSLSSALTAAELLGLFQKQSLDHSYNWFTCIPWIPFYIYKSIQWCAKVTSNTFLTL